MLAAQEDVAVGFKLNQKMASETAWIKHPVISTVLWILGTVPDKGSPMRGDNSSGSLAGGTLKWKDETGGNMNEYYSHAQTDAPDTNERKEEETQLKPGVSRRNSGDAGVNGTISPAGDYTPSPQWGFYVPITPPQEQFGGRGSSDNTYSPSYSTSAAAASSVHSYFASQQKK
jgi:hypothetical protein